MNEYGLGLVLSFTDNLSSGVDNAIYSLNGLVSSLERVDDTASTVSLMALCSVAQQVGDTFEDMGLSILGVFSSVFDRVMDTGSMFENYKVTLNALYGDAQKARDELSKMFSFAVTSPVDMEDVMPYIVKLKTLGLEAFDTVSNKAQTTTQNMISWVTDFMSVASGMGASADRISRAVINFLNPENTRSLMMMRNIFGDIESLITQQGDTLANTVEGRVQNLTSILTSLGANGITESMMGKWSTMISNMKDVFMQFWLGIADGGAFDSVERSLQEIIIALNSVDTTQFGQVLADGLKIITVPLQTLAHWLSVAIVGFTDFATAHPFLVKVAIGMTAVVGVGLVLGGVILKLGAQFGMMAIGISTASRALNDFNASGVLSQFTGLGNKLKWLTIGLTALYIMWNKDFGGIKTKTIAFVNNVNSSFSQARSIISMNCNEMKKAIDSLDSDNPFDNFTKGLVKVGVLIGAVKEGLSNRDADGNFILSANTYAKICELGLDGLVGRIFDAVYAFERFVDGFKTGWQAASDAVSGFLSGFRLSIKGTFLDTLITKVAEFADNLDFNREKVFGFFETLGEYAGKIAPLVIAFMGLRTVLGGLGKITGGISGIFSAIGSVGGESVIINGLGNALISGIGGLGGGISTALTRVFGFAFKALNPMNFVSLLGTFFINLTSKAGHFLTGGFIGILNTIGKSITGGRWIQGNGIAHTIMKMFGNLGNFKNFGAVFETLGQMLNKSIFAPFKILSKVITGPFQLVGKLIGALANPFGAILAVITGIGSAFTIAYEKSDAFRQKINELLGLKGDLDFSHIFDGLKEGLGTAWEVLKSSLGDILSFDWLKKGLNFGGDGDGFGSAFESIKTKFLDLWETAQPILARIGVVCAYIAGAVWDLVGIIGNVLAIATKAIAPLLQGIVSAVMIAVNTIIGYVQGVIKVFSGVWDIISGVITGIIGLFTGDMDLVNQAGEKIKNGFNSIVEGIKQMFSSIIDGAKDWVTNLVDTGYNMVMGIWDGFLKAKDYLLGAVKNFFSNIVNAVKNLLGIHSPSTVFAEIGGYLIDGLIQGAQNMLGNLIQFFTNIGTTIISTIEGFISLVTTIGSSIVGAIVGIAMQAWEAVTSIFNQFGEFFTGVWNAVVGLFTGELSPSEFFGTVFQEAYDLVTGIFGTLGEFFSGVWKTIVDLFSTIGSTVGDAVSSTVKTAINSVLSTAVRIINGFISAINSAIGVINSIPGVSISKLSSLSTPQLAEGGIVDKATLAVVGEAGKEAVMPLENNTEWINKLAVKIGSFIGMNNTGSYQTSAMVGTIGDLITTVSTFIKGITHASMDAHTVSGLTTIINQGDTTSNESTVMYPPTNNNNFGGDSYHNTTNTSTYITRTSSNTSSGDVDNSVTFEKGSIIIQANGCSDAEAERLANLIIKKIERKKQIKDLTQYKSLANN